MGEIKEDKRVRRTKRQMKEALVDLLREKEFDKVTVKDIIEKADYNRTTFYNHYQDKYDLVEEIETELLDGLVSAATEMYQDKKYIDLRNIKAEDIFVFDYIYEYKDYFILWKYQADIPKFQQKFFRIFVQLFKGDLKINYTEETRLSKDELTFFVASGFMGMILKWIHDDFKETPYNMSVIGIEVLRLLTFKGAEVQISQNEDI